MPDRIVFAGLCAVLLFVPLPIGSVREWSVFAFEAATLALFLLHVLGGGLGRGVRRGGGRESGRGDAPAALPVAVKAGLAIFAVLLAVQVVPLPEAAVEVLSPRAHAVQAALVEDGIAATSPWMTLSLSPAAGLAEIVLTLCYGLFGYLVLRTARSRRRIEVLVLVVLASALFQAFYGMAEVFSGHEAIWGRPKRHGLGSVTGTYVNRNHLAGFLEMAFPLSLGYLLVKARYFAMEKGLSLRRRIVWFGQESLQWTLLLGLVPVFIGLGIVFSKSRSGIMVFAATAALTAAAAASWRALAEEGSERRLGRLVRVVVAAVLAAAVWLGVGPVVRRFADVDITTENRRTFYANTLEMIGDFPLTGAGKGSFVNAYPMYEKLDDRLRLSFAHNDYLELAAENGLPAAAALVAAGAALLFWLFGLWRRRRDPFAKGIGMGAGLGVVALLLHGFTDFNLQIPANAVYFTTLAMLAAAVLGRRGGRNGDTYQRYMSPMGAGQPAGKNGDMYPPAGDMYPGYVSPKSGKKSGDMYRRYVSPVRKLVKSALAAALAVALFVPALRDFVGFRRLDAYRAARRRARSVESAFPALEARLLAAAEASPRAVFDVELGRLYLEMGRVADQAGREEERDAFCDRAVARYLRAVAANPIDAGTRYEIGMAYLLYNYPLMTYQSRASAHFRRALELKPADETINMNFAYLHFSWWPGLDEAEKAVAADIYRKMAARDPGFPARLADRWTQAYGSTERLDAVLAEIGPIQ